MFQQPINKKSVNFIMLIILYEIYKNWKWTANSPTNSTFHTRCGRANVSDVNKGNFWTICPNTDFIPSIPASPPLDLDLLTWILFNSMMGPWCFSLTIVDWTTFLKRTKGIKNLQLFLNKWRFSSISYEYH